MPDNNYSPRAIIAAIVTIGTVGVAVGMGTQLVSILMANKGISPDIIGYSGTVGGIATVISAACTSRIAVTLGVVRSILIMMIVGASSFLGFYYFQSLTMWFILRFILHFAMTIMFILSEFWVNNSAPRQHRGFVLAIYAITLGLGFTAGPTIISNIGSEGFLPFGIGCGLIALSAIPILCAWNLSPQFPKGEHVPFLRYVFSVPSSTMAVLVYGAIQMGALTLIASFSKDIGYADAKQTAGFMTMLALGNVLLLMPIGMISDRIRDKRYPLMGCALIGFIGAAIVPWVYQSKWLLSADLFVLGGVSAGLYTIGLAQLGAKLKGSELAAANSAFIFCYGIGMLVGPTFIGTMTRHFPPFGFAYAIAIFFALYVLLVFSRLILRLFRS